jgi:hypothetical protein
MLDARYFRLDIQSRTGSEIQRNQASRNQYPGSIHNGGDFRRNSQDPMQYFMQL